MQRILRLTIYLKNYLQRVLIMSKKIYQIISIILLSSTSYVHADSNNGYNNNYGYSVHDINSNLSALMGGGDQPSHGNDSSGGYTNNYGYSVPDDHGNLSAIIGGGDGYSQNSDNSDGRYNNNYGYPVPDDHGNLSALLGGGDSYSDIAVSPEY